jgi:hypothetical protein
LDDVSLLSLLSCLSSFFTSLNLSFGLLLCSL